MCPTAFPLHKTRLHSPLAYLDALLSVPPPAATILIGASTGAIAFVLEYATTHGILLKNDASVSAFSDIGAPAAFARFLSISLVAALLPCLLVQLWAPEAAGAGVMLVMLYLNGNHVPDLLRMRTLAAKVVGQREWARGGWQKSFYFRFLFV